MKNQTGLGEPVARLVPDLLHEHLHRLGRPGARAGRRLGPADLRLPPELRRRHGRDDRQGNQGSRAGDRVPERRAAGQGRRQRSTTPARGKFLSIVGMALALLRNYDPFKAPTHFKLIDLLEEVRQDLRRHEAAEQEVRQGRRATARWTTSRSAARDRWNFLFIAGMWFQDLFNYDFRRTEMCIIPYATQQGEISFCAYNTGIGWRNIIEKMHMTATLTKWYEEHGRHEIFAGDKAVPLDVDRALAGAERGGRSRRRADRPRRARASPRTRARRSCAARKTGRPGRRRHATTRDGASSTASTCSRSSRRSQIQGLGGGEEEVRRAARAAQADGVELGLGIRD